MANPQTFFTVLAMGKEATWGTSVARTAFLPIEQPRFQPKALRNIIDTGLRGKASQEFDVVPGPGEGTFSFNGNVYLDTFGHILQNILGADTITGAGPYTHTFKELPTTATALSSHSVEWQNGIQSYLFAGARYSSLTLNFQGTDGLLTYQAQGMSKLGTTTAPTATAFTSVSATPGWNGVITIAGDATPATLLEGSIQLQRGLRPVHGVSGSQDLSDLVPLTLQ